MQRTQNFMSTKKDNARHTRKRKRIPLWDGSLKNNFTENNIKNAHLMHSDAPFPLVKNSWRDEGDDSSLFIPP